MKILSALLLTLAMTGTVSADLWLDNLPFVRANSANDQQTYFLLRGGNVTPEQVCSDRRYNAGGIITYDSGGVNVETISCK